MYTCGIVNASYAVNHNYWQTKKKKLMVVQQRRFILIYDFDDRIIALITKCFDALKIALEMYPFITVRCLI